MIRTKNPRMMEFYRIEITFPNGKVKVTERQRPILTRAEQRAGGQISQVIETVKREVVDLIIG